MTNIDNSQGQFAELRNAGYITFWRNDNRFSSLPVEKRHRLRGFYQELLNLVCYADGAKTFAGRSTLKGEYHTTLSLLADRLECDKRYAQTQLEALKKLKIIGTQTVRKNTIITICNYGEFHDNKSENKTLPYANGTQTVRIEETLESLETLKEDSLCAKRPKLGEEPTQKKTPREQALEKGFLELWEAGKNKNNRQSAEKKFLEAIKKVSLDILVSQRKAYNLDMEKKFKGRDVNYQALDTWLHNKRWEDEYTKTDIKKSGLEAELIAMKKTRLKIENQSPLNRYED